MYSCLLFYSGFYKEIVCKEKWTLDDIGENCIVDAGRRKGCTKKYQ